MTTANRTKFKEIFAAAVNLPTAERAAFLADSCAGNSSMRGEIERLIAADEAAGEFLESSPFDESNRDFAEIQSRNFVGQKIGAYGIVREIGAGGMGTVFLAVRDLEDIQQQVAVKIVHQGAYKNEIIRRFLIERKILAELSHSGIARLIDAGQTAEGLPFLVMEYVDGEPLDTFCRAKNLSLDEHLNLFRQICAAVAYAHRRLIIHRDLKPSNILVTTDGEAKLLDFGIAKLLAPDDEVDAQTATLMNLLTPAYAAPEQIRGESVTTATDVYSLGVILYELLAGVRPFAFGNQNYQEIVRVICETEPLAPSRAISDFRFRISDSKKTLSAAVKQTGEIQIQTNPQSAITNPKLLKGDLDNIILKALRKDPERRYQSVEQFSEDLARYQKGLPISARADTFSYRASKFFQRNRVAVASFGLILLALVGGIVGTSWQAIRAARQQKIAEQRFAQVRELANNVVFKYHDAIANLQGSTEVRQMLVADATKYLDRLSLDSGADENLRNELALAYAKLADVQGKPFYANTGDSVGALENYRKSINLLENLTVSKDAEMSGRAEEELIVTYHSFSALNSRLYNFDEAINSQKKALNLAISHLASDTRDFQRQLICARAYLWLGDAYGEAGDYNESVNYYWQTLISADEIYQTAPDEKDAATLLGVAHDRIGRGQLLRGQELARTDYPPEKIGEIYREGSEHLEKTLELFKKVADANPGNQKYHRNLHNAQSNFGMALRSLGKNDRSLEILQKVNEETGESLQSDVGNHQLQEDHAEDLHQLALTQNAENQTESAARNFQSSLEITDRLIADDPGNMQIRRVQLEIISDYGDYFLKKKDISGALKISQTAFNKISADEKFPENNLKSFAKGWLNKNTGDCYTKLARSSEFERQIYLQDAETYYRSASNFWQNEEVRREFLSRTPELLEYLNRKL